MQLSKFSYIFFFAFLSYKKIQAQETWKRKFGIWINVELDKRLKLDQPIDSTVYIIPRFLWIRSLKEIEIEQRFEQKRKYQIKSVNKKQITIKDTQLFLKGDTIIMKDNYVNVVKFIKYE
ncbi:MAG: hypothetical protein LH478_14790 [Chitinophagaceae bacterium]|nr:hypothetical protein [Chitinophagaceae bacterium]